MMLHQDGSQAFMGTGQYWDLIVTMDDAPMNPAQCSSAMR